MPLKVNVGLSQKVGLPDYGSLGASCHVEYEADSTLLTTDLETFQRQVKNAFVACKQAVQDELHRHQSGPPTANGNGPPSRNNDSHDSCGRRTGLHFVFGDSGLFAMFAPVLFSVRRKTIRRTNRRESGVWKRHTRGAGTPLSAAVGR